jgi:pyruvate dehydrogenase E1 component alpha subunit
MVDVETLCILGQDGVLVGKDPGIPTTVLQEMYRSMVLAREFDRRLLALQRQGRIGTYPMLEGQEAVQVGSAMALAPHDFVFPSYREHGVQIARGVPIEVILAYWRGLPNAGWDVAEATGWDQHRPDRQPAPPRRRLLGYVSELRGDGTVTAVYFGDGATSEVDFHSGMNFAGVWKTPTVFICSNNLYAISVPYDGSRRPATIAQKAVAYGMPGSGWTAWIPWPCTQPPRRSSAPDRGGPTLIEAVTYRYGPHATADDPTRTGRRTRRSGGAGSDRPAPGASWRPGASWDEARGREGGDGGPTWSRPPSPRSRPARCRAATTTVRHAFSRDPPSWSTSSTPCSEAHGETETVFDPTEVWEVGTDEIPEGATERWTMAEALTAALRQALERDERVIVLGEDVGLSGGVFRITEGLQAEFGESG